MTALFEPSGPRWYTIPAHRPFVDDLALGLHAALSPLGPEALADAVVLVPTRRGARALADAFVRVQGGRAILPPQMRPLGDLEAGEPPFEPGDLALDLPAAIDPLRRRFELTRLVAELSEYLPAGLATVSAALDMADALGGFLDGLQIEEAEIHGRLAGLVDAELAQHWQVTRVFLEKVLTLWPQRLATLGVIDVSERRVRLLRRLAQHWTDNPPLGVLIAAGSTGTAPAARALLIAVAAAPQGAVVLPGLDTELDDKAWASVDAQHPQGALKRLLEDAEVLKANVRTWPASAGDHPAGRWRQRVINEALRPAEATGDWLDVIVALRAEESTVGADPVSEGLRGLRLVMAPNAQDAAMITALLLRETLETPDQTAALVTPDQTLARRVRAQLQRWGIVPDSSVGESLAGGSIGALAATLARAAHDPLDPVTLLALAKHPRATLGDPTTFERLAMRGPRRRSWAAIEAALAEDVEAAALAARLRDLTETVAFPASTSSPAAAARRTVQAMELLAGGPDAVWAGPDGEGVAQLLSGLIQHGDALPDVTARGFVDLLVRLMERETIRAGGATHPRLRILGAIEARLVRADRLILAGLEEGVWPGGAGADPFLSRPMRQTLDLPSPERRIGLAAHDFAQAASAPEVILLHTERREGSPTVKSRWLWRLETLARGAGLMLPGHADVQAWARGLDATGISEPACRPTPCPPLSARPRRLAVTRVETLTRDPYAVWARDILRLYQMRRPDEAPDARERGTAIHTAFETFARTYPVDLPQGAAQVFEQLYVAALRQAGMADDGMAREAALAGEIARWVEALEHERRADGRTIHVEVEGRTTFETPGGPFTVTAKADRIERTPEGFAHILDFKTGAAPTKKEVDAGFSPQLTLTAAILNAGGFADLKGAVSGELTYLQVTGRRPAGEVVVRAAAGPESAMAAELALLGLKDLIARYDDPRTPYASRTAPQFVKARASDYDHLARVFEWSTSGDEADDAE